MTDGRFTRRACLQSAAAAVFGGLMSSRSFAAEGLKASIEDIRVISWKPPLYHGWPTLARRKNGELLLAYSGGREAHVCPFGRLELMRSKDNGQTWGWPQVIHDWSEPLTISADGFSSDLGYPSTVECDDGTLVTVWYEVLKTSELAQLCQARWRISG